MPPLPTATYFIEPHTGSALTKCMVVLLDPISGVVVMRKRLSRQLSGRLVQIGTPTDWDPDKSIPNLSNNFIRLAFKHDATRKGEDVESLRRDLKHYVMMPPDEVSGQSYIVNHWGLAFPVMDGQPIVLRKGNGASLATLTLYNIFTPTGSANINYLMPHIICVRPQNTWWVTIKETILEILRQHFAHVSENALDKLEVQRIEPNEATSETVMRLSMPFPLSLYKMTEYQQTTLKTLR
ncbi:MAG: hypothetical protein CBC65_001500 [Rhodothermaceae bacterium TMED105]|jgi:hypothetical protein|nr:MAG: hypothetical protein CBC65_001500 [Rhodothermaceae bacterium TMED105]